MLAAPAAFVRRPSARLADGLVTHVERSDDVDPELALLQWRGYVEALWEAGYTIHELPLTPECPDGVFVEDIMVVAKGLAVITRPGAVQRRAETAAVAEVAQAAGLRVVELADAPVQGEITLDGGDVLKVGGTAYVGIGGRTTSGGAQALAHHLSTVGMSVSTVPLSKTLHLKSQVGALPDGTVVGFEPLVDDPQQWSDLLRVPEPEGAHVVRIGEQTVLMADAAPRTAELYRERGLRVVALPMSELIKMEGCVTCLSVRVHPGD